LATGAEGSPLDEIMKLADDRMYQEKKEHKNATANHSGSQ
jgi:hypothetical protein